MQDKREINCSGKKKWHGSFHHKDLNSLSALAAEEDLPYGYDQHHLEQPWSKCIHWIRCFFLFVFNGYRISVAEILLSWKALLGRWVVLHREVLTSQPWCDWQLLLSALATPRLPWWRCANVLIWDGQDLDTQASLPFIKITRGSFKNDVSFPSSDIFSLKLSLIHRSNPFITLDDLTP